MRSSSSLVSTWLLRVAAVVTLTAGAACGGGTTTTTGAGGTGNGGGGAGGQECVGGVYIDGECVAKCEKDLCVDPVTNTCVDNACVLQCQKHADCAADGTQDCVPAVEDDTNADIMICAPNGKAAGFGQDCPLGDECPATAPHCQSTGQGDADAYCTVLDCAADTDCPGGYECTQQRFAGESCTNDMIGTWDGCGNGGADCVAATGTIVEGTLCLMRSVCTQKTACSPCTTNLDCSSAFGAKDCVDVGGGDMRCADQCADEDDCDLDKDCVSGHCLPRFGACVGAGGFCEPCLNDLDCGEPGSSKVCTELSGGMHACFDLAFPDTCDTDADCPESPSGENGTCLDEGEGLTPGDSVYKRCYLPIDAASNKTSCW